MKFETYAQYLANRRLKERTRYAKSPDGQKRRSLAWYYRNRDKILEQRRAQRALARALANAPTNERRTRIKSKQQHTRRRGVMVLAFREFNTRQRGNNPRAK
jgi:hypothetical protein